MNETNQKPSTRAKPRGAKRSPQSAAPRPGATIAHVDLTDPRMMTGKLKNLSGSNDDAWTNGLLNQVLNAAPVQKSDPIAMQKAVQSNATAIVGLSPRHEVEGMLAAQMVAMHNAAMECMRRVWTGQTIPAAQFYMNAALRLSRTYASHLETLDKHRGGGQQKVTVEHVHVHQGGQAIVGNVTHQGVGQPQQIEGRPDAKDLALSHLAALPSPDPQRDALPIPQSEREEAMQDARRS
jgi:hypothetical protein